MVSRKPFALLLVPFALAMALALAVPSAAAAAADYPIKTVYNYCDGTTVKLKMRITSRGYTDANKLTIESWAQRKVSGAWQTVHRWNRAVFKFEANGNKHSLTAWRSYHGTQSHRFRIVFRLRAWDGRERLHSTLFRSVGC